MSCRFQQFPPGHYYDSKTKEFTRYYNPQFYLDFEAQPPRTPSTPYDPTVSLTLAAVCSWHDGGGDERRDVTNYTSWGEGDWMQSAISGS